MFQQQFPNGNFYGGYSYAPRPVINTTQPVTAEMSKMINQENNQLDIRISNVDRIKNWCTHKEPNTNRVALVENPDGTVTCRVCGETFRIVEDSDEEVVNTCRHMNDIIQTIKTTYLDIPEEFLKGYSQIMSIISKTPELWKRANKNFSLYESYTGVVYPSNPNMNPFAAASGILGGFNPIPQGAWQPQMQMGGMPMGPQGWPNGMTQQPQMTQQPNMNGQWATPPQQPQMAGVPYIDPNGNVMPGMPGTMPGAMPGSMPMGPTTMGGNPMAPGFNPLMNNTMVPGNMTAPTPTGPQQPVAAVPAPQPEQPTQTKQMSV